MTCIGCKRAGPLVELKKKEQSLINDGGGAGTWNLGTTHFEQSIFIFIFCPNICHEFFKPNYYLTYPKKDMAKKFGSQLMKIRVQSCIHLIYLSKLF